jgi:hypothetical protein
MASKCIFTIYILHDVRVGTDADDSDDGNHDLGTHFFHADSLDCT